jgi:MoxR-like ATPase
VNAANAAMVPAGQLDLTDGVSPDELLGPVLNAVPLPDIPMHERHASSAARPWSPHRP